MLGLLLSLTLSTEGHLEPTPDYCGKGPVTIKVQQITSCPNACSCDQPVKLGDTDIYMEGLCTCTLMACYDTVKQNWTDYPECGGKQIYGN